MRRREFMALIGGFAIAWSLASYAQQPKQPLKRVGIIASLGPCPLKPDNIVVRRLGELGWVEGRNFVFDCVSAVGRIDQVPALARELVSRRPDVLMAGNSWKDTGDHLAHRAWDRPAWCDRPTKRRALC
jgi:putative ABC transport system substrate-binding protein